MSLERNIKERLNKKQKREILLENNSIKKKNFYDQFEKVIPKSLSSIDQLSEIEKDVLNIAKDILKLKKFDKKFSFNEKYDIERYPIIGQLFSNCISKIQYKKGYSKEEIFLAIRNLVKEGWIISEGSRTKLEILNDKNYKKLIRLISKNPGIHAFDCKIEKELGITRNPFIKRVMTLLRFKIIRMHKIGKIVHFFLNDIPSDYDELKALFLNPIILRLIIEVSKDKYISGIQLGNILHEPVHKIYYYLKKIKDLDVIKERKDNVGKKCYWINKKLLYNYNDVFKEPRFSTLI